MSDCQCQKCTYESPTPPRKPNLSYAGGNIRPITFDEKAAEALKKLKRKLVKFG